MSIFKINSDDASPQVRTVQEKAAMVTTLQDRHASQDAAIAEAKANVPANALAVETGGDSKAYDKAVSEVERLQRAQARTADALGAARQELATAERDLQKATKANREKDAIKLCGQRQKATDEAVAAMMQLYAARQKLHEVNRKIVDVFGAPLTLNHGGTQLSSGEIQRDWTTELARISAPLPLDDRACPALPGSASSLYGNPAAAEPLTSVMEVANAELVRRVSAFAEAPAAQPTASEPSADDPANDAGQTVDAAQIMAGIAPRKLA